MHGVRVRLTGVIGLSEALVKSRKNARIRHNFTRNTCFYNFDAYFEISFARRIFADFAAPVPAVPRQIVRIRKRKDWLPSSNETSRCDPSGASINAMRVAASIASVGCTGKPIPPPDHNDVVLRRPAISQTEGARVRPIASSSLQEKAGQIPARLRDTLRVLPIVPDEMSSGQKPTCTARGLRPEWTWKLLTRRDHPGRPTVSDTSSRSAV